MTKLYVTVNSSSRAGLVDLALQQELAFEQTATYIILSGKESWTEVKGLLMAQFPDSLPIEVE